MCQTRQFLVRSAREGLQPPKPILILTGNEIGVCSVPCAIHFRRQLPRNTKPKTVQLRTSASQHKAVYDSTGQAYENEHKKGRTQHHETRKKFGSRYTEVSLEKLPIPKQEI